MRLRRGTTASSCFSVQRRRPRVRPRRHPARRRTPEHGGSPGRARRQAGRPVPSPAAARRSRGASPSAGTSSGRSLRSARHPRRGRVIQVPSDHEPMSLILGTGPRTRTLRGPSRTRETGGLHDQVVIDMSMSLDGFVAGPNDGVAHPFGRHGGEHVFDWYFSGDEEYRDPVFRPEPGVNRDEVEANVRGERRVHLRATDLRDRGRLGRLPPRERGAGLRTDSRAARPTPRGGRRTSPSSPTASRAPSVGRERWRAVKDIKLGRCVAGEASTGRPASATRS